MDKRFKQILIGAAGILILGFGFKTCMESDDPLKGKKPLTREEMQQRGRAYAERMAQEKAKGAVNEAFTDTPKITATPVDSETPKKPSASPQLSSTPVPIVIPNAEPTAAAEVILEPVSVIEASLAPPSKPIISLENRSLYLKTSSGPTIWVRINDSITPSQLHMLYSRLQKACLKSDPLEGDHCANTIVIPSNLHSKLTRCESGQLIAIDGASLICKNPNSCWEPNGLEVTLGPQSSPENVLGEVQSLIIPAQGCRLKSRVPASSSNVQIQKILRTDRMLMTPASALNGAAKSEEEIVLGFD